MKKVTDPEIIAYIDGTCTAAEGERIRKALESEGRMGEVLLATAASALLEDDSSSVGDAGIHRAHPSTYNLQDNKTLPKAAEEGEEYRKKR